MPTYLTKVKKFDGHVQSIVTKHDDDLGIEDVYFIYGDGRLLSVGMDVWCFGVNVDDDLTLPGGYPLPEDKLDIFPNTREINNEVFYAESVCRAALRAYRQSPDYLQHLDEHMGQ